jgi:serine/threonine protein kinase
LQDKAYPQPGEVLEGKYRVERYLGVGGMGAVARATHLVRKASVALKFMSPAVISLRGATERFANEAVAASQIDSDHVVRVLDVGRLPNDVPYLVMELLDGTDLAEVLSRQRGERRPLDVPRAVHLALQMLRGLQAAHAAGIVHRDMKPSNVFLVSKDGEPDFVKLVDFGISKVRAADPPAADATPLTNSNSALGTPLYMSPEQARSPRDVDHRTDLYAVGAILYECLSGRTPYVAPSGEITDLLFQIFTTEPTPLSTLQPDLPEGLVAVVHRALTRDLTVRFGSALEMAEALAPFADERSAEVVARIRATRGASMGAVRTVSPPDSDARARPEEAMAKTAAAVPTDVGMTREATVDKRRRRRFELAAGVVVVALLVTGVVVVRMKNAHSVEAATQLTAEPAPPPVPLPLPSQTVVLSAPSEHVTPVPSASASQSATAVGPLPPPQPSRLHQLPKP